MHTPPEFNRALIRLSNRVGLYAEQVAEVFELSDMLHQQAASATEEERRKFLTPENVLYYWKESYVEP
jgi:hypothetical protein